MAMRDKADRRGNDHRRWEARQQPSVMRDEAAWWRGDNRRDDKVAQRRQTAMGEQGGSATIATRHCGERRSNEQRCGERRRWAALLREARAVVRGATAWRWGSRGERRVERRLCVEWELGNYGFSLYMGYLIGPSKPTLLKWATFTRKFTLQGPARSPMARLVTTRSFPGKLPPLLASDLLAAVTTTSVPCAL